MEGNTRVRRVNKAIYERAKKLISMNDSGGGGYSRAELGRMMEPHLSNSTMSKIAVCSTWEDYLERTARESAVSKKCKQRNQISMEESLQEIKETPSGGLIIETEDERLIWEAKAKVINCIDIITNQLTIIAKALELMYKNND